MICLVRSGRSVCRWAAARPLAVRAAGPASVGLAAVCAGGRRPAREIATREPAARSDRSRGPPWPCRHPPAPRPGPPVPPAPSTPVALIVLTCCPDPAATHGHRDRALRSLRRPPHLWGQVAVRQLYASSRSPARPRHRPRTPQPGHSPRTRPHKREKMRPARLHERNIAPAGHSTAWLTSLVKEISPLLAQNGQNTALFGVQGRRIFHGTPQHLTQGRFFFHPSPIPIPRRGKTRLARLHQHPHAKKFAQHRQNCPKSALFR